MTTSNFSIEDLATALIVRLDRAKIFPPEFNNPEYFNVHQEAKRRGTCNMRVISKVTGILWRNASLEEKEVYERLADQNTPLRPVAYKPYQIPIPPSTFLDTAAKLTKTKIYYYYYDYDD
ncbi:11201_t:CDS:2 [Diversispora eburnea]|uniref:11201_t:CDS:1 n=1 Tax=Diversispora eburnea TaxID=1213867 RepID=A0A9N8Z9V8_9GLOM|nr:11201_t:CDS:2 [Diversispora eburnea]